MDDSMALGYALGQDSNNGNNCNGNGMWGDGAWWIIIILAILFANGGWGNNGNNGNNGGVASVLPYVVASNQGALTRGDLCSEFAFNDLQNATRGISNGICDSTFALSSTINNGFRGVDNAVCSLGNAMQSGFNATNVALMQGQNALSSQLCGCCCDINGNITQNRFDNQVAINGLSTQLAQCCCENRYERAKDTCAIQQSISNSTRDIVDSQNAGTRAILDYLCNEKISDLQNENQALRLAASQSNQNNALMAAMSANTAEIIRRTGNECPIPAYVVPNPNCCYGNPVGVSYGNNGNSGCCNNCGGCC